MNFKMVRDNRSWKFWYWLSDICDEKMENVIERMNHVQDVGARVHLRKGLLRCWSWVERKQKERMMKKEMN